MGAKFANLFLLSTLLVNYSKMLSKITRDSDGCENIEEFWNSTVGTEGMLSRIHNALS